MSRIPPALLYLTIYNPTLQPTGPNNDDDEDAEEQAHVLFYTARERAVSRDKILRQVGLAKALVNFSSMLGAETPCENVHSQSRRMIMLSPEPNFWIHACVELAKTPRQVTPKRNAPKTKGKEPVAKPEVVYDHHDGSLSDLALRTHIQRGYELFKLIHGSFTSIISTLGQQALELQLERFFTVWAWKWDADEDTTFSLHLGLPLHPLYRSLTTILDEFASQLSFDTTTFLINAAQVIPSTSLLKSGYAPTLPGHIGTRIPPSPPPVLKASSSTGTVVLPKTHTPPEESGPKSSEKPQDAKPSFMPMPHMNLDMRNIKWSWPGYLTFGRAKSGGSPSIPPTPAEPETSQTNAHSVPQDSTKEEHAGEEEAAASPLATPPMAIDTESLQDAISSDHALSTQPPTPSLNTAPLSSQNDEHAVSTAESVPSSDEAGEEAPSEKSDGEASKEDELISDDSQGRTHDSADAEEQDNTPSEEVEAVVARDEELPLPIYLPTTVHLSSGDDATMTRKKRVWHATLHTMTFALVVDYDHPQEQLPPTTDVAKLFRDVEFVIKSEETKVLEASIPTVTKLLEPQDKHIIVTGPFTVSSQGGFTSRSEHFFSGQQILRSDLDAQEVFSRGANPQHWYVSRRCPGGDDVDDSTSGEAYMEIARKESTLTDVDNALAGIVRRFVEG
ncbi:hypothetical protein BXZ70DRAFT_949891 [Cristinia sonorae]|uniref:CCZ1/INTU/HSP4 first Longin domain-containing protein n=1 Tax=Cristinia sonorae TaxID=1940300 RepID=A0A8K0UIM5_9AGAR|nr:hypothetical protein BXZ70DRAFT_949891 [Cristinia sonorae]